MPETIASVDRALAILDLFDWRTPELGISEIARRTNLPKGTVAGLVYTLVSRGYLLQNAENRKYRLGLRLAERATVALHHFELLQAAHHYLEKLSFLRNKSVNLGILQGIDVLFVDHISAYGNGNTSKIGNRLAIYATGLGKAMMSALPREQIDMLLLRVAFQRFTPQTIGDHKMLLADLARIRERGFALDDAESAPGILAIAAPVFDWRGQVAAAVSMAMPYQRFRTEQLTQWGKDVRATAIAISRDLGLVDVAAKYNLTHSSV